MKSRLFVAVLATTLLCGTIEAQAGCGEVVKTATAKTVKKATKKAIAAINAELEKIRMKMRKRPIPGQRQVACLGGAVYIDSNGNQVIGDPSCTVTQPYCF
jgi:hypothetical protein